MTTQSTDDGGDLRTLIEECDALTRCDDCGKHVVNLHTHRCPPTEDSPATHLAARRERAERDTRDDGDLVGVFHRTVGNTYAYHEVEDGEVCCGCDEYTKAKSLDVVPRSEAKALGRSPCGNCERLLSLRDG